MKKLSICIPTYNRSKFLEVQLKNIFAQIERFKYQDFIEVIVSNNCSPDNTDDIVIPYIGKGLIYYKQAKNIGPDNNFFTLFEMAQGEYLWLLGDDDNFVDNILEFIINAIQTSNIDYLYLRTNGDTQLNQINQNSLIHLSNDELFKRVSIMLSFMSSQLIKTKLIKKHLEEGKAKTENLMGYFYVFLRCLEDSKTCAYSESKKIYFTADNTGGYNFFKVWGKGVLDALSKTQYFKEHIYFNQFRNDIFFDLILPMINSFRSGNLKSKLDMSEANESLWTYYSGSIFQILLHIYLHQRFEIMKIMHQFVKIYTKLRSKFNMKIS